MPGGRAGGGHNCSISYCNNNSEKTRKSGLKVVYHTFPTDHELRREWVERCNRKDEFDPNYKRVCSTHFTKEDYEDAIEAYIKGVSPKRLKKGALPTLNLHSRNISLEPTQVDDVISKLLEPEIYIMTETPSLLENFNDLPVRQMNCERKPDEIKTEMDSPLQELNCKIKPDEIKREMSEPETDSKIEIGAQSLLGNFNYLPRRELKKERDIKIESPTSLDSLGDFSCEALKERKTATIDMMTKILEAKKNVKTEISPLLDNLK